MKGEGLIKIGTRIQVPWLGCSFRSLLCSFLIIYGIGRLIRCRACLKTDRNAETEGNNGFLDEKEWIDTVRALPGENRLTPPPGDSSHLQIYCLLPRRCAPVTCSAACEAIPPRQAASVNGACSRPDFSQSWTWCTRVPGVRRTSDVCTQRDPARLSISLPPVS